MKFNWGTKIALFYISFVTFIIVMVVMAFSENYELVTENYYEEELSYQEKIDKTSNADNLLEKLQISIKEEYLIIRFPSSDLTEGMITFFRPSDEARDFEIDIEVENSIQKIPLKQFIKGKYLVKIDWTSNAEAYFQEKTIIIP